MRSRMHVALAAIAPMACAALVAAQAVLSPPFDTDYAITSLGPPVGAPSYFGGMAIKHDDPNTLLLVTGTGFTTGAIYSVPLTRDGDGHITGFAGDAVFYAAATQNDGMAYGPDNVLFVATYPSTNLHQIRPGSSTPDRTDSLTALGIPTATGAVNFVPASHPGAGRMKVAVYSSSRWFDVAIEPDGIGTFTPVSATEVFGSQLSGGIESFIYVPLEHPQFPNPSLVITKFNTSEVYAYDVDENGDPIPATERLFIDNLSGAEGATLDPTTGDFLFGVYALNGNIIRVSRVTEDPCRADFNGDGFINPDDLTDYITCFFLEVQFPGTCPTADFNGDFFVNPDDLTDFITTFFLPCP
jgi:hypothetical protein